MPLPRSVLLPVLAVVALTAAGCGSNTKTVTVETPASAAAGTTGTTTATTTATTTTTSTQATAPARTSTTATTRSAPEPSFTEQETHAESAGAAAAVLQAHGYTANDASEYHPDQTLRVLVGTRAGSADGYGQQAFFFLDGRYLGTDTKEASAKLRVVSQSDTEVAIAYPLYRPGNSLCCPAGGEQIVHFALNDGKLTALDPIPPANSKTGVSRN
jgi:hypothetical protein